MRTADVASALTLPEGVKMATPGDTLTISMKLEFPMPIKKGDKFAIREGGKTIAAGLITEVLQDTAEDIKEEEERLAKKKKK
jgi:elongation factor Tu